MEVINGTALASALLAKLKQEISLISGRKPCVAFIRIGNNPASATYVNRKQQAASEVGIESRVIELAEDCSADTLFNILNTLNTDNTVDGILVQSPLPKHLSEKSVFSAINPNKDVDGFHPLNLGKLAHEVNDGFVPCTPAAVLEILKNTGISLEGKHVVIVGRSLIVGKPLALLLSQKNEQTNATITLCHSKTQNLAEITKTADILIAAIGQANFIKANMVREGCVVIDVGINRIPDSTTPTGYKLTGDVDFAGVANKTNFITPVPGGVGPLTVAMLMKNTLIAYQKSSHE